MTRERLGQHRDEYFILGYFEGDRLAGIVGFLRKTRSKQKHIADIWGMYVHPDFRGKGIGKALLSECLNRAKSIKGLAKVNLSVTHLQTKARKLHQQTLFYG